jgi:hypothetical protein
MAIEAAELGSFPMFSAALGDLAVAGWDSQVDAVRAETRIALRRGPGTSASDGELAALAHALYPAVRKVTTVDTAQVHAALRAQSDDAQSGDAHTSTGLTVQQTVTISLAILGAMATIEMPA